MGRLMKCTIAAACAAAAANAATPLELIATAMREARATAIERKGRGLQGLPMPQNCIDEYDACCQVPGVECADTCFEDLIKCGSRQCAAVYGLEDAFDCFFELVGLNGGSGGEPADFVAQFQSEIDLALDPSPQPGQVAAACESVYTNVAYEPIRCFALVPPGAVDEVAEDKAANNFENVTGCEFAHASGSASIPECSCAFHDADSSSVYGADGWPDAGPIRLAFPVSVEEPNNHAYTRAVDKPDQIEGSNLLAVDKPDQIEGSNLLAESKSDDEER